VRAPRLALRFIARLKPVIPAGAWPLLNTVASTLGAGPLVADPPSVPTLVLLAHPDDELGCAGTLALLGGRVAVTPIYATHGDGTRGSSLTPEETGRRRGAEAAESCKTLGLAAPSFLAFADGTLPSNAAALTQDVEEAVRAHRPEQIFVPWFLDGHPDHRALSRAVAFADVPASVMIWAFEWWTALPPNRIVDVSSQWSQKEAAAACHVTAAQAFDITAGLGLSRWRSLHGLHGKGYAEGFLAMPHPEYRAMVERAGDA